MAVMSFVLQDEIFDMVKPTDPYRISLQDLVNRSVKYIELDVATAGVTNAANFFHWRLTFH